MGGSETYLSDWSCRLRFTILHPVRTEGGKNVNYMTWPCDLELFSLDSRKPELVLEERPYRSTCVVLS